MAFVHLGIHSEYSVTDSLVRIDDLVEAAARDGMPALALTDLANTYAAVKFYKACRAKGIKPILGAEIWLEDNNHRVTLLASSNTGWRNLTEIISRGYTEGQQLGIPLIKREWLFAQPEDLILLLGQTSDVGEMLAAGHTEKAATLLTPYLGCFADRLYLTASRTRRPLEDQYLQEALQLAWQFQLPVVAHNDVRFMQADDFDAHEARVCIATSHVLADEKRPRLYTAEQYFKTAAEMTALFADLPQLLENTVELARRCTVSLTLGKNFLPDFPVPDGYDINSYFSLRAREGLKERLQELYPELPENWSELQQQYDDRLQFEIDTIIKMGFPGYFLIVMDFIQWAKQNGVPVGPGRGSGAGSLVAYSLKITDLDPLAYELLFERFLNPERVSMPDFDVDFCIAGRDRVIDYVAHKYGREAVSQIITFGTMAAKAVVKDVARVQGKSYGLADRISKLIPKTPGITLKEAVEQESQLKDLLTDPTQTDHEDTMEIWEMALKLEGITRNVGKHAGGVLIAPGKITDFCPVYCDDEGARVSQFDKDDVEQVGLVKFDFLGLRNLTVIDAAMTAVNERRQKEGQPELDLTRLPLDDGPTYSLLQKAHTTAVFQLESSGMKKYLARLKPTNIEDVIAMCALYRPGPLDAGMVDMYINRKHGLEPVEYDHPDLEGILGNTYGVIVYQEQVMQISQVLAQYTLGGADMLRRAMGKKKPEEMATQREIFVTGARNRGIDESTSGGVFDLMEKFAGYGFNKSHSAAYGLVAYQTAWLKAHYPAEFMAAVLSSEMHNTDTVVFMISDCRKTGLVIQPPSVNASSFRFVAGDPKTIIYGLGAIKGVGESAMQSVIDARSKEGPFRDLFDFCHRIDTRRANRRTLEALIRAGAMDCFGQERAVLMAHLEEAIQAAEQARTNREAGFTDLFGEIAEVPFNPPPARHMEWTDEERLQGEKATLGLYLTGHPIDIYEDELKKFIPARLADITSTRRGVNTTFAGLLVDIRQFNNRVLLVLDDGTGRIEVSCAGERFQRYREILKIDQLVIMSGEVYEREGMERPSARLQQAFSMGQIRQKRLQKIIVQTSIDQINILEIDKWLISLKPFTAARHRIPLQLVVEDEFSVATLLLDMQWALEPSDQALRILRELFGRQAVQLDYQLKTSVAVSEKYYSQA